MTGIRTIGICMLAAACCLLPGCTQASDRMVERHMSSLESDLRFRGTIERASTERQFETFRKAKHIEIDQAHNDALAALDSFGKLDAASARKASDRFTAMHSELDRLVGQAKTAALEQAKWYDLAADTIAAEQQYQQAKAQALVEAGQAFLQSFGATYAASRGAPATETEAKAQGLMDQIQGQLRDLLASKLGVVTN